MGTRSPGLATKPIFCLQEQLRRGEKFLQPLAGWEAVELGPHGARFLALQAQLTKFSRALAQRRQRLTDAEMLLRLFKQVGEGPRPWLWVVTGARGVPVQLHNSLSSSWMSCLFSLLVFSLGANAQWGWGKSLAVSVGSSSCVCVALMLQASTWAEEGQRVLAELEQERPAVVLQRLQLHWTKHPDLPPAHFRKMWALATGLGSEGIRQECRCAWTQCQDTWLALDQKLEAALKPPPTGSTASLCVSQVPATPTIPPLRKAYSLDRNLGQSLREPAHHGHHAAIMATCHGPEAGCGALPESSPAMPPPGSSDPRSLNR